MFSSSVAALMDSVQDDVDQILEKETQQNKTESWNKLNKTTKIQKLHQYAEKYGNEHKYSEKETTALKQFFIDSLERGKLVKTKEVVYDKNQQIINDIPGLSYQSASRHFTLKAVDAKRVSTLKSLTPKRLGDKVVGKIVIMEEEKNLT